LLSTSATNKPPEAATYAERFAASPIYGKAHGLPYDESKSVFHQPNPVRNSGTSRASSVCREDSDTSQYLASLGPKEPFKIDDCQQFRRASVSNGSSPLMPRSSRRRTPSTEESLEDAIDRRKKRLDDEYKKLTSSLPPPIPRQEKTVTFKHVDGPRGPMVRREELTTSTRSVSSDAPAYKPPISSIRSRRISVGSTDTFVVPGSQLAKYSSQHNITKEKEPVPFCSSQQFRDVRRKIDSDLLTDQIKKTLNGFKGRDWEYSSSDLGSRSRATSIERDMDAFRPRTRFRMNSLSSRLSRA